jgi:hypothetical protein
VASLSICEKQMAKKMSSTYITVSNGFIRSTSTKELYRVSEKDFTRDRKLTFEMLALCMLKLLRRNLQLELHSFFDALNAGVKKVTASAFVQSRKKVNPDLFYALNHLIAKEYYTDNDENVKLHKGLRVLSIDGSTINLPVTEDTVAQYGFFNNHKKTDDVVIGRVSVLYDVLNEIVIDGLLRPFKEGEVTLAYEHFKYVGKGDLIIMDRGYPGFELAYTLQQKGAHFLFRCKEAFSNQVKAFYESGKRDAIIELKAKQHQSFKNLPYHQDSTIKVRVLRIELDSGETEILMTSLLDKKMFPYKEFKNLYFKRWGVETYYDRFKNIISVENFSGTSHQFIQQEFNCALYMSNMQTILTQEAQDEAEEKYKDRKYEYKINRSVSLSFIRERLLQLYSNKNETEKILAELKQLFILNVIPVRPGRRYKRDVDKYRQRTNPKQFKNRRIVI